MPHSARLVVLWLMLSILLLGCTPTAEPELVGTWGVCNDGTPDENRVVFGIAYEEVFRFFEDGTDLPPRIGSGAIYVVSTQ